MMQFRLKKTADSPKSGLLVSNPNVEVVKLPVTFWTVKLL